MGNEMYECSCLFLYENILFMNTHDTHRILDMPYFRTIGLENPFQLGSGGRDGGGIIHVF